MQRAEVYHKNIDFMVCFINSSTVLYIKIKYSSTISDWLSYFTEYW